MTKLNSWSGQATLSVGHMAGMIDLAALPLWIGSLMKFYGLAAPQAGLTVTAFLAAVVVSSVIFAPMFTRLRHRLFACLGYCVAGCAFLVASWQPVSPDSLVNFMLLHAVAGFGVGAALSVTHGAMGRSANPHRLFGIANVAMGILAVIMFAILPGIIAAYGGQTIFRAFAITMAFGAVVTLLFFPEVPQAEAPVSGKQAVIVKKPLSKAAWLTIGTIVCIALNQAMVFAFVERIGDMRDFGEGAVQNVLIVTGFVNLLPGLLAAVLQKKFAPADVGIAGPILQAVFALSVTGATTYAVFAVPATLYVALVIFTHTFMFGLLSRVDETGRAVAATPAMMMIGSAAGPALGGFIVAGVGYPGLGWAVTGFALVAVIFMLMTRRELARQPEQVAVVAT
ncbi:MFS transporter [Rhizobium cremeum]|uniref:MFS transporter n=1 Tax=Rhizobium cremeum TaxID=2813827 RepID=UPI000DE54DD0